MKKTINIIIKQKDSNLGPINSCKKVALGYAFNYLIPKELAEVATDGKVKHINMIHQKQVQKKNKIYSKNLIIKQYLEKTKKINIRKKIGQNQQIFGKITENEITESIFHITGQTINKKQIQIPQIKNVGIYNIKINIEDTIYVYVKLQILPRNI